VESAVGAYLLARSKTDQFSVHWWRDDNREVDFVIQKGLATMALEVKSGRIKDTKGLFAFMQKHPYAKPLVIGDRNTSVEDFLSGKVPLFE
jgi:predicted AAA+ superfamily ATPase